ncbi:hypothetical protein E4T47_05709 [Aureobasidium subglaciale]|nr:hypothetical protein E4T47_05709 [Aureobasidium subglaciale]
MHSHTLREIASIPRILYARCRDFSGPNKKFVDGSGTLSARNTDFPPDAGKERQQRLRGLYSEAFPNEAALHEISLWRETLGCPQTVLGVSVNEPFYSAILQYQNKTGEPFSVTYESGIDQVPSFDAHLAFYGEKKRVCIAYDSPYVKGLPIKVVIEELNEFGGFHTRVVLGSYEDAHTKEMLAVYECFVNGAPIKTTGADAKEDIGIFNSMYAKWMESHTR